MRVSKAVQVQVGQTQTHHVGRDVVALDVGRQAGALIGREQIACLALDCIDFFAIAALSISTAGIGGQDVLPGRNEEARSATGRVKNGFVLLRVNHRHHEVDDVARRAELARIALAAQHAEQVFKGIAQALGVVVAEVVDFLQKAFERFGVAVGQVGVFEDVAKQLGHAGVFAHALDGFAVQRQHLKPAQAGGHEFGPAKAGKGACKKAAAAAEFFGLGIHVVHELVNERNGDLLYLALGVGHFAHQDVAAVVNAFFGGGVEHFLYFWSHERVT
jgi:hypothetical protein